MLRENDDNIKIFQPKMKDSDEDLALLAQTTLAHRGNGNIEKAKKLGEIFAALMPEDFCPDEVETLNNRELFHLRALIIFSARLAFYNFLPHSVLSYSAINSMYDSLEKNSNGFFINISNSSSFTFYAMSGYKTGEDAAASLAKSYCMLCEKQGDEKLTQLARSVYNDVITCVVKAIEDLEFIKV
ncbi:MAG: hypothetical protein K6B52_00950 [Clostridiales bacterium]|nr:hypothetical protein [Clostridiales bacterium]